MALARVPHLVAREGWIHKCITGSSEVLDAPTSQQTNALLWFEDPERQTKQRCDCYLRPLFPKGHPLFAIGIERKDYWERQYGRSEGGVLKGIGVLQLGGIAL